MHSVDWEPRPDDGSPAPPCLLCASMDRTMMLWRPDATEPGEPSRMLAGPGLERQQPRPLEITKAPGGLGLQTKARRPKRGLQVCG